MIRILFVLFFSTPAIAQQLTFLGKARDQKLVDTVKVIREYCENNYPEILKEEDGTLLCYIQLQADRHSPDEKLAGFARSIHGQARYLEKAVVSSQVNARQMGATYVGSELDRIRNPCKYEPSLPECNIKWELAAPVPAVLK